jgi:hypothetical protein
LPHPGVKGEALRHFAAWKRFATIGPCENRFPSALIREAIEQRGREHLVVSKNFHLFAKREIRGDDDAASLVAFGEEIEEQLWRRSLACEFAIRIAPRRWWRWTNDHRGGR